MVARRVGLIVLTLVAAGCQAIANPSPSIPVGTIPVDIAGTWERCHQMGACKYTIQIKSLGGSATAELVRLNAPGNEGKLIVEDPFPATLAPGPHDIVVLSTMYGDTIEPNGELTSLGEEARCEATFQVAAGETGVHVAITLVPGSCTVTVSMDTAS